ncbi:GntR family transcriptional regulator [Namhaeicola litoreus]|uniref:GntR family transcriptional regulator n=1 Tax=Namhaeicola litoreus TaxID=1052145 RepID=A0ABW3Y3B8_9FLAO
MKDLNYIQIDENSRTPKYKQIVDSFIYNISIGNLKMNQKIPSINVFSEEFYLSRDTVEKAYRILKERKIISSIRGKGFYITRTKLLSKTNVLFLINKLSTYKMKMYNSFVSQMGDNAHTDLHIYHCDKGVFLNLLNKNLNAYDYYVIMPHFRTEGSKHLSSNDEIEEAINQISKDKLIILDNKVDVQGDIIMIYQDFENDIYNALKQGLEKIKTYNRMILAYPENSHYPYPRRILHGFRKFCVEYSIPFDIINQIDEELILKDKDLFITIEESDLVNLVKLSRDRNKKISEDLGIISYNDTPLKELLGITVISTDFHEMGKSAAEMVLKHKKGITKNPFLFIDRNSI